MPGPITLADHSGGTIYHRIERLEAECRELRNLWERCEESLVMHLSHPEVKKQPDNEESTGMYYEDAEKAAIREAVKIKDQETAEIWEKAWKTGKIDGLTDQLTGNVKLLREWAQDAKLVAFDSAMTNNPANLSRLKYYLLGFEHAALMLEKGPGMVDMLHMRVDDRVAPDTGSKRIKPRTVRVNPYNDDLEDEDDEN